MNKCFRTIREPSARFRVDNFSFEILFYLQNFVIFGHEKNIFSNILTEKMFIEKIEKH